jgi:hypothetical protein
VPRWDGVDAAWVPGVASQDPARGQVQTADDAVGDNRVTAVGRASGVEPAPGGPMWCRKPVKINQSREQPRERVPGRRALCTSRGVGHDVLAAVVPSGPLYKCSNMTRAECIPTASAPTRATSATSTPWATPTTRAASRSTRLARLRATAPPTRFDATTVRRPGPASPRSNTCTTATSHTRRRPRRRTARTSSLRCSRSYSAAMTRRSG